ncbi:hypothetical protein KFE98_16925 [bacterium SCSIO 12741]|nr:hypothetical protein KFE98_16925 [bacterium SCSIO 12741]
MKRITLLVAIISLSFCGFAQNPPSTIVNTGNGLIYHRIQTVSEYLSLGGSIVNVPLDPAWGKKSKSGSTLNCGKGQGCCWHSVVAPEPNDILGEITLVEQYGDDGSYMPETPGLYAYYNAQVDEILFHP